jgi:hypothetical protein
LRGCHGVGFMKNGESCNFQTAMATLTELTHPEMLRLAISCPAMAAWFLGALSGGRSCTVSLSRRGLA